MIKKYKIFGLSLAFSAAIYFFLFGQENFQKLNFQKDLQLNFIDNASFEEKKNKIDSIVNLSSSNPAQVYFLANYLFDKSEYALASRTLEHFILNFPNDTDAEVMALTAETKYSLLNLKIYIPEKIDSGNHFVDLSFKIGSKTFDLKLKVNVYDYVIPKLSESNFFYTNWFNLGKMEEYHGVERWTDEWYTMLDKYAKVMAEGRQNCIIIPGELIYLSDGEFQLDEQKMISFINIFRKYGFKYFESPHLLNRGVNDDWGNPELKTRLKKVGYYSDEGKNEIASIINKIRDFTEKYNLKNQWLQHIADEPTSINAQCYVDVAKQIKEIYPEIKIMEATNTRDSLGDAIDIWCPIINDFQENLDFFREREKKGEKILVYTCLVPGGKWLNRTLDMEKLRQVYFGWGGSKYNTLGYLHWGLNQYKADPFKQSVVKHPSPAASSNNYLPAGDTHVIYPGKNGPLSSLRFEAHRIGAEDYEMLESLKIKNSKIHKKLINKIFKNYTDYSLNINKYLRVKKKLLKSLTT